MLTVTVDANACQGHARCNLICPEVFGLDELGHSVVLQPEVTEENRGRVMTAVNNCPEEAITVV